MEKEINIQSESIKIEENQSQTLQKPFPSATKLLPELGIRNLDEELHQVEKSQNEKFNALNYEILSLNKNISELRLKITTESEEIQDEISNVEDELFTKMLPILFKIEQYCDDIRTEEEEIYKSFEERFTNITKFMKGICFIICLGLLSFAGVIITLLFTICKG